jgi:EAL domain-containing protein (putative c-di-GMP-specific phosphodiesterase class I)/GGDEF domain-containing protein
MKTDKRTGLMGYDDFICQARRALVVGSGRFYAIAIDISNFRYINNIYGLLEGDRFLSGFARECCFGEHIICATRTHSDHFLLLLEDNQDVNEVVEQLASRHQTFIHKFKQHFSLVTLHMNVGLYALAFGDKDIVLALDKAQSARKQNKGNFNCPILVYTESLNQKYYEESKILPIFEKALENKDILVYMQPKIDASSGKLVGMEALARLRDTDGTIIPPSVFIPILEKTGRIIELDRYMAEASAELISKWIRQDIKPIPISINLSRIHFQSNDFLTRFTDKIEECNIPTEFIELEITENIFFENAKHIFEKICELKESGYKVSMDDFGAGYSSLNLIGILPVDVIKLDKGFLRDGLQAVRGKTIIKGLISILNEVGLGIVCEGVETREEEKMLKEYGCSIIQGFLYDGPLPIPDFEKKYMHLQAVGA